MNGENEDRDDLSGVVSTGEITTEQPERVERVREAAPEKPDRSDLRALVKAATEQHKEPSDQERDELGRWSKKQYEENEARKAAPKTAAAFEADPKISAATTETPTASNPLGEPPSSWSKEAKAHWSSIPPEVARDIAKREQEMAKGSAEHQQAKQRYQDIDSALAPYRGALQQVGKSEGEAIRQMIAWQEHLSNPRTQADAFKRLAASHGFDLSSLVPRPSAGVAETDNPQNEILKPFLDEIHTLRGRVETFEQQQTRLQQEREQAEFARAQSQLADFSKDKPHFETVRVRMGKLMEMGEAKDLETAYQMAVWADPTIREELKQQEITANAEKQKAEAEAKRKAAAEAAAKASRAAVSPRTMTPGAQPGNGVKKGASVRDSIAAAMAESSARL